jgi:hypothetical protein
VDLVLDEVDQYRIEQAIHFHHRHRATAGVTAGCLGEPVAGRPGRPCDQHPHARSDQ